MNVRNGLLLLFAVACGAPARAGADRPGAPNPVRDSPPPQSRPEDATAPAQEGPSTSAGGGYAPTRPSGEGSVLIGEIAAPKHFNPSPTVQALAADFTACFRRARASNPSLHGKLKLRVVVNEAGAAQGATAEPGGSADDPALVSCLEEALKTAAFPKPGGTAIVIVPLVFRR